MRKDRLLSLVGAGALLVAGGTSVSAQSSSTQAGPPDNSKSMTEGSGTTSGPASGTPTTMGSGGTVPATPHQLEGTKNQSSSVTRETGHSMGQGASQTPHGPGVGVKGGENTESGPTAGDTAERAKQ
jgi:hypothetical protein